MKKTILILFAVMSLSACSTFNRMFPDNRDEYKSAETLPNLEIPPDLTKDSISDIMGIPSERMAPVSDAATPPAPAPKQAQMLVSNGRSVVAIPEELPVAWTRVTEILTGSGVVIDSQDQQKGVFNVTYTDEENSGWFSSLLRRNRDSYVITLSAAGTTTELVILDEDGEWSPTERSDRLLSNIMTQYNMANSQTR